MTTDSESNYLKIVVESSFSVLDMIVDKASDFCIASDSSEEVRHKVMLLSSEAVTNAIKHGNALADDKTVEVEFFHRDAGIEIWVQDEGDGFNREDIPDPLATEHLMDIGGRGIFLIEELADEVRYELDGRRVGILLKMAP